MIDYSIRYFDAAVLCFHSVILPTIPVASGTTTADKGFYQLSHKAVTVFRKIGWRKIRGPGVDTISISVERVFSRDIIAIRYS